MKKSQLSVTRILAFVSILVLSLATLTIQYLLLMLPTIL